MESQTMVQDSLLSLHPRHLAKDLSESTARRLTLEEVLGAAHQIPSKLHRLLGAHW